MASAMYRNSSPTRLGLLNGIRYDVISQLPRTLSLAAHDNMRSHAGTGQEPAPPLVGRFHFSLWLVLGLNTTAQTLLPGNVSISRSPRHTTTALATLLPG